MSALELAVFPLDVARRQTLRFATRSALLTRVLGRRDSRVAVFATLQVALLFAFVAAAPVALFFIGPVVFGVAHLGADVRYLVLRQKIPTGLLRASVVAAGAIVLLRVLSALHVLHRSVDLYEIVIGTAWVGAALAFAASGRQAIRRAAIVAAALVPLAFVALTHVRTANLALAHGHNVVAIGAWLALYRRRITWGIAPVLFAVVLCGATLLGAVPVSFAPAFGKHLSTLGGWLAPGAPLLLGARIAVVFVFLQGVHYAVWTGWIPQDALRTEGTLTFRMTVRGLLADFGPVALGLLVAVAAGFAALGALRIHEAYTGYMTLARFHGWLELAMLGFLFVRRSRAA